MAISMLWRALFVISVLHRVVLSAALNGAKRSTATATASVPKYTFIAQNVTTTCPFTPANYTWIFPNGKYGVHIDTAIIKGVNISFPEASVGSVPQSLFLSTINQTQVQVELYDRTAIKVSLPKGQRMVADNNGVTVYTPKCDHAMILQVPNLVAKANAYAKTGGKRRRADFALPDRSYKGPPTRTVEIAPRVYTPSYVPVIVKIIDQCDRLVPDLPAVIFQGSLTHKDTQYPLINDPGTGTYYDLYVPWVEKARVLQLCKDTAAESLSYFDHSGSKEDLKDISKVAKFVQTIVKSGIVADVAAAIVTAAELPLVVGAVGALAAIDSGINSLGGPDEVARLYCDRTTAPWEFAMDLSIGSRVRFLGAWETFPTTTLRTTYTTSMPTPCPTRATHQYPTVNLIKDGSFEYLPLSVFDNGVTFQTAFPKDGNRYITMTASYFGGRFAFCYPSQYTGAYRPGRPLVIFLSYRVSQVDGYGSCTLSIENRSGLTWTIDLQTSQTMSSWATTSEHATVGTTAGEDLRLNLECSWPQDSEKSQYYGSISVDIDDFRVYALDELYP